MQQGDGLFDVFEDIGKIAIGGIKAVHSLVMAPVDLVVTLGKVIAGDNFVDNMKDFAGEHVKEGLKAVAAPSKMIHRVSDELGVTDEVDLLLMAAPSPVSFMMDASQLAEGVEQIIDIKEATAKAERELAEFEEELNKLLDDMLENGLDGVEEKKEKPVYIKASRASINRYAQEWLTRTHPDAVSSKGFNPFNRKLISTSILATMKEALLEKFVHPENGFEIAGAIGGNSGQVAYLQQHVADAVKGWKSDKNAPLEVRRQRYKKYKKVLWAQKDFYLKSAAKRAPFKPYSDKWNTVDDRLTRDVWRQLKKASTALGL